MLRIRHWAQRVGIGAIILGLPTVASALLWPHEVERLASQLSDQQVSVRREAASRLHRLTAPEARRLLPKVLVDADVEVRQLGAQALLQLRLRGFEGQVQAWLADREPALRRAAADVLAFAPVPEAVPTLGRLLSDPDAAVRLAAARALGASDSLSASLTLLGRLEDPEPAVREAVIAALERLRDPRSVIPLLGKVQDERGAVRRGAVRALGVLGDTRAVTALVLALRDSDARVRIEASLALGELMAEEATTSLISVVERDLDPAVRAAATRALGRLEGVAARQKLVELLTNQYDEVQSEAKRALGRGSLEGLALLHGCVTEASPELAEQCVAALGESSLGQAAATIVVQALQTHRVPARACLEALAQLGEPTTAAVALEYLLDDDLGIGRVALRAAQAALAKGPRDGRIVDPIERALNLGRWEVADRVALIELLGRSGAQRASEILTRYAMPDAPRSLRRAACEALGRIGPHEANGPLLEALGSDDLEIQWTAAEALRAAGTQAALPPLWSQWQQASERRRLLLGLALAGPVARASTPGALAPWLALAQDSEAAVLDVLLEALAQASSPEVTELWLRLGRDRVNVQTRAKLAETAALVPGTDQLLLTWTRDPVARVRANALWALSTRVYAGRLSDALTEQARRLAREGMDDSDLATAVNATAALGRLVQAANTRKEVLAADDASLTKLCSTLTDGRDAIRRSGLAALGASGAIAACDVPALALGLLTDDESAAVRKSAAQYLARSSASSPELQQALIRCAQSEPDGEVARVCAAAEPSSRTLAGPVTVFVHSAFKDVPAPGRHYALQFADGFIRFGVADRRGASFQAAFPGGPLKLEVL